MECGHLRRDLLVSVAIVFGNFFLPQVWACLPRSPGERCLSCREKVMINAYYLDMSLTQAGCAMLAAGQNRLIKDPHLCACAFGEDDFLFHSCFGTGAVHIRDILFKLAKRR
jgi:hypothetical protein